MTLSALYPDVYTNQLVETIRRSVAVQITFEVANVRVESIEKVNSILVEKGKFEERVVALYDYCARSIKELDVCKGDILNVDKRHGEHWIL